jgi:hypothetical protein
VSAASRQLQLAGFIAGNHFRGDQRKPGDPHADLQAGEDERHGAGQDHVPKNVTRLRPQAAGGAEPGGDAAPAGDDEPAKKDEGPIIDAEVVEEKAN